MNVAGLVFADSTSQGQSCNLRLRARFTLGSTKSSWAASVRQDEHAALGGPIH